MSILKNNDTFAGSYVVRFFIKEGSCAETYRVCDIREQPFFLKIFDLERIPAARLTKGGMPFEVEMCARLEHPSLVACRRTGIESIGDKRYAYLITDYIQGGLLAELLSREHRLPVAQAVELTIRVLEGLSYLHGQAETLIHNDITARNIMYDCVGDALLRPRIIDMGHLSHPVMGRPDFQTSDLELCYRAPETFIGIYSKLSDLFSVGVLLYEMIYGCLPWSCDASKSPSEAREELREARKAGLRFPEKEPEGMTEQLHKVLQRALALIDRDRFGSADEFIGALRGEEVKMPPTKRESAAPPSANGDVTTDGEQRGGEAEGEAPRATFVKGEGNGFADVAGMEELKQLLRAKVINVLQDRERALKYRLAIPNGMLLYGPPGCGKTFIAEKFAEETGFNYTVVKSSDLASIYIHGSQRIRSGNFSTRRVPRRRPCSVSMSSMRWYPAARSRRMRVWRAKSTSSCRSSTTAAKGGLRDRHLEPSRHDRPCRPAHGAYRPDDLCAGSRQGRPSGALRDQPQRSSHGRCRLCRAGGADGQFRGERHRLCRQRRGHHGGIRQCAHFSEDSLRNARLYAAVGHGGDAGRVRQAARQDDRHGAAGRTYSDRI